MVERTLLGISSALAGLLVAIVLAAPSSADAAETAPAVAADAPAATAPVASAPAASATAVEAAPMTPAEAGAEPGAADAPRTFQSLDEEAQGLKEQVMDLNRELFMLEEELLFPANTQVAVYVSYDVGTFFGLDSVQVRVDDKEVANYLYTSREVDALERGGVHRIWLGNMKVGKHVVTAFFTGKGPHDRDYRTGATIEVEKGVGAKYLELKISDRQQKLQPEFIVKQWD